MRPKNDLLFQRRKVRSRAAKIARRAFKKGLSKRSRRTYYLWSIAGSNHGKRNVEVLRENLEDKAFKVSPGLRLMNEQHRKRESKRCGRMIR